MRTEMENTKYNLSSSMTDRIRYDDDMKNYIENCLSSLDADELSSVDANDYFEEDQQSVDDIDEAKARFKNIFSETLQLLKENRSYAASALGSIRSPRKAAASRKNGKLGGRPPTHITVSPTPQFGGGFTLTDKKGNEMDNGTVYPTREEALNAAKKLYPDGRGVRNGWRIKI